MAKRGRKPKKVVLPPVVAPEHPADETRTALVIAIFPDICERWARGDTMEEIAAALGIGTGAQLRKVIENNRALRVVLEEYTQMRADALHEKAVRWGHQAALLGDARGLKVAIDTALKAAAQMAPHKYGDVRKTEFRDGAGRLVATATETSSVSPGEAYERMLKQGES